mmetsp:Transcript_28453/g.44813  ORF Transcript_28453/g.44813 Transcript_28453/m.44813 type:complete len:249 (-) Transcript_28453:32-778(-)
MPESNCKHCTKGTISMGFCPFSLALFAGTALSYVKYIQNKSSKSTSSSPSSTTTDEPFRVVFVLGGPGAGKGTQCELLSKNHGWAHLSAGDLLRAERKKENSPLADIINSNISAGKIVPSEITTQLIKNAMVELRSSEGQIKFLIDGFPRSEGNVNAWEEVVGDAAVLEYVLFFECPYDILTSRLLERGKTSGRSDDSLDVIRKRFNTYRDESMPIIEMYEKEGKVRKIMADRSIEDVYAEVESILKN